MTRWRRDEPVSGPGVLVRSAVRRRAAALVDRAGANVPQTLGHRCSHLALSTRVDGAPAGFNMIAARSRLLPQGIDADFVVHEFCVLHPYRGGARLRSKPLWKGSTGTGASRKSSLTRRIAVRPRILEARDRTIHIGAFLGGRVRPPVGPACRLPLRVPIKRSRPPSPPRARVSNNPVRLAASDPGTPNELFVGQAEEDTRENRRFPTVARGDRESLRLYGFQGHDRSRE